MLMETNAVHNSKNSREGEEQGRDVSKTNTFITELLITECLLQTGLKTPLLKVTLT